jgi:mRNA-degrading endonuclease RelE of RelBE toxin-antitoxin system
VLIVDAIDDQLIYEPHLETRNRKLLESNPLGAWELRIGRYRVFYDFVRVISKLILPVSNRTPNG